MAGLRSEGFWTSHNGSSVNFLGDGTIFWGGRHENSSVFGGQPAGFTSNSVGTRLNEAHHDLAGLLGSEVVGMETAFVTGRRDRRRP